VLGSDKADMMFADPPYNVRSRAPARAPCRREEIYSKLMNLCVWNKSNAGMGSLYCSKHELIFVFKVGKGAHVNNVALEREVAPPSAKRKILLVVNRRGVRTPIGVANPLMFLVSKGQISAPNQTVGARLKLGSTFHSVTT
jgi:hypothetical protein